MAIDIFNIEPTVISRDLKGKYLLLYGKPKCGKTSFSGMGSSLRPKPFRRNPRSLPPQGRCVLPMVLPTPSWCSGRTRAAP